MGKKDKSEVIEFVTGNPKLPTFTVEHITNAYICDGLSPEELSVKFYLSLAVIENIIETNKLEELRSVHIKNGLEKLQNTQLIQAEKLLELENSFKKMRILQLQGVLEDYMAYYSKHGHFYKIHPVTLDILRDTAGMPMQIPIPSVTREIAALKESVGLSEGMKMLLDQIDKIINKPKDVKPLDPDTIDMDSTMGGLFKKKSRDED